MKLLRRIPLFPFLLVVFFCLHGSVENYGYIDIGEVLTVGLFIIFCVLVLILAVYFVSKNYVFASLIIFFVSLWYLFFGALHDWIKSIHYFSFLQSYSVIIPVLIAATIAWMIIIIKKRTWRPQLVLYLNILLLIYCCIDGFSVMQKYFAHHKKTFPAIAFDFSKVRSKPNVYYLLFDEYPGYKSLQDSFGFRNDSLYNFLQEKGFKILPTYSNYEFTPFSMSSILNMQFVDSNYNHKMLTQSDIQERFGEILEGKVFSIFKLMNYQIENYSIFDISGYPSFLRSGTLFPLQYVLLTDKMFHNRLVKDLGWWFITGKFKMPGIRRNYLYQHDANNKKVEKMVIKSAAIKSQKPKLVFAHFLLPHSPFYRDSLGNYIPITQIQNVFDKSLFLAYLKYTNSVIQWLVENIETGDPNAIVIVMSDHGFHNYENRCEYILFNFDNICLVKFPDKNYQTYKGKLGSVNFFPYLFNSQYGQNMSYLNDSTIFLKK